MTLTSTTLNLESDSIVTEPTPPTSLTSSSTTLTSAIASSQGTQESLSSTMSGSPSTFVASPNSPITQSSTISGSPSDPVTGHNSPITPSSPISGSPSTPVTGDNCQYINLAAVTNVTGCQSGAQFVVEEEEFVTGHLVVVTGELLLVFVRAGRKLSQCDRYTDITSNVTCQVINSL